MRLGLIARADNGGLGAQTWEFWRHLQPAKTAVIDMSSLTRMQTYPERYPGVPVFSIQQWWNDQSLIEEFCEDLDAIFTCETPYNWSLFSTARNKGVKTVLHGNYEFLEWFQEPVPPCDELWMASMWKFDQVPWQRWGINSIKYIPTPVDRERCRYVEPPSDVRPKIFLHVAGQDTVADRNGTVALYHAIPHVRSDIEVIVYTQHQVSAGTSDPRVTVRHIHIANYWDLYRTAEVLILPRRYGGQSLQMQEALSCGLPVISTAVDPQTRLLPPAWLGGTHFEGSFTAKTRVDYYQPDPVDLAAKIDWFAERELLPEAQVADRIAAGLSWEVWEPQFCELFEQLCK